jgi:6-pyruvoyltetrahydropterin/6-carboxytetrahydropterin synthase
MVYLTRKEHFNSAHKLRNPEWSEKKNFEVFGKCANPNWHGHNFELTVTIKGMPDPETGFIMNVKELGKIIKSVIIEDLDHKNLNLDVPWLEEVMPTIENVSMLIWERLKPTITKGELYCVKLGETEKIYVEYYGD